MTHKDIYTKFMIEYDKAQITSSYPSLTKYEVATILDKAYLALIAQKLTGNNQRGVLFEGDIKAIEDIRPLIKQDMFNYIKDGPASNEKVYKINDDMLYYIQSSLSRLNKVSAIDSKSHLSSNVLLLSHNDANNFKSTSTNLPWMPNPVSYIEGDEIHVLIDPFEDKQNGGTLELTATYIKKPAKFAFAYDSESEDEDEHEDEKDSWTVSITGDSSVYNKTNTAQYSAVVVSKSGITSRATFSIVSGSEFAYITSTGKLTVKNTATDASGQDVTIKATNILDSDSYSLKTINVRYFEPDVDPVDPVDPDDPVGPDDPDDPDSKFPTPEAIDLGLSVKWAKWNMGAKSEYDTGGYYGWGDPTGEMRSWTSSDYANNYTERLLNDQLDIATQKWGAGWRLPTEAEVRELIDNSTKTAITVDGVPGYNLTCNGQAIFIPKGGYEYRDQKYYQNYCCYWTKEQDDQLHPKELAIYSRTKYEVISNKNKATHMLIRPVYDDGSSSGDQGNQYDKYAVDLGLTSLWSSVNLNGTEPQNAGGFFAWGEIQPKGTSGTAEFTVQNYEHTIPDESYVPGGPTPPEFKFENIGNEISNTEYDAVKANWGGKWHMPTYFDFQELNERCTWELTTVGMIAGYKVTGPSGNNIFLPLTGYYTTIDTEPSYITRKARYLAGTLYTLPVVETIKNSYCYAYALSDDANPQESQPNKFYRYWGGVIRPVRSKS